MAYKDMLLPKAISFGGMGGPTFSTDIVQVESGFEFPNQNWTYPLAKYEVSHAARLPAQWIPLRAFFYIAAGRANTWNYWDPLDYSATAAEGVFLQLTSTTFQAYKKYTFVRKNPALSDGVLGSVLLALAPTPVGRGSRSSDERRVGGSDPGFQSLSASSSLAILLVVPLSGVSALGPDVGGDCGGGVHVDTVHPLPSPSQGLSQSFLANAGRLWFRCELQN